MNKQKQYKISYKYQCKDYKNNRKLKRNTTIRARSEVKKHNINNDQQEDHVHDFQMTFKPNKLVI